MTVEVNIPGPLADEMVGHCLEGRPHEACGILATKDGIVVKVFRMTNASGSPVRYSLDPKEQFAAYRKIDDEGWELGGVFHSHTHTEAYPSPTDVRMASEEVPYLIVSLAEEPPVIRAFRIIKEDWLAEEGRIEEVPVVVNG
ncbi:MAG: [CysO sulfur-carrier protein]-S-L-cysteine hydrolase [Actinomycetota bacterium]|nr:[CysO sulfur-carrier protein]-S-L-cysteine hydrolase [Actinomycetota bacterium]